MDRSFPTGRSESFENVLEGAVGDELLGELVAAGPHLALNDAVLGEPVLANPVEPWGVDVNRYRGETLVVVDPVDVAGAALARCADAQPAGLGSPPYTMMSSRTHPRATHSPTPEM